MLVAPRRNDDVPRMKGRPVLTRRTRFWRRATAIAAVAAAVTALSGCAGSAGSQYNAKASCSNAIDKPDAVKITVWAWSPTIGLAADAFNKSHDDVQACVANVGAGNDEYNKLNTAIAAGSGAPDVAMIETEFLSSFEIRGALVDLSKYGAERVRDSFSPGTLKDISSDGDIYAIPDDGGPVALMYRKDVFDKYHLPIPTTWAQFEADAVKLKAEGGPAMADFPSDTPAFQQALANQAGSKAFEYSLADRTKITVDTDNSAWQKVMSFWQSMVKRGLVATTGQQTTDYTAGLGAGKYATMIAPSWEPGHLTGNGFEPGKGSPWRVAPLPQWNAGDDVQVNWGGSTYTVTTQSQHPKLAAEVAIDLFDHETPTTIGAHFPQHVPTQKQSWFAPAKDPFFAYQKANQEVWIPASTGYRGTVYSPFQQYYYAQVTTAMIQIAAGKPVDGALAKLQSTVASYATSQGFQVKK